MHPIRRERPDRYRARGLTRAAPRQDGRPSAPDSEITATGTVKPGNHDREPLRASRWQRGATLYPPSPSMGIGINRTKNRASVTALVQTPCKRLIMESLVASDKFQPRDHGRQAGLWGVIRVDSPGAPVPGRLLWPASGSAWYNSHIRCGLASTCGRAGASGRIRGAA